MRKLAIKLLSAVVVAIMVLQTSVALAVSSSSEQGLENEKQQNNQKINEAQNKKEEITKEKNKTVKEVEDISAQITEYENQINSLDTQIETLNEKITEAQANLDKAEADYKEREKQMENRLIAIQEYGETTYLDMLLSSSNLIDFISNYFFVSELVNTDTEFLESIKEQKQKIEDAKQELETSKNELDTAKSEKEEVSGQLKVAKSEKDNQVQQLTVDEKKIQEQIDELKKDNQAIDAKMAEARKKLQDKVNSNKNNTNSGSSGSGSSSNGSSGGGSSSGGAPTGPSSSGFIYPVPSGYTRITTGLYYSSGQYHGAVDFGSGGISGQPVYAVADGVVLISENLGNRSYGNYIIIEHYNGLFTLYAHGQDGSRTVSVGDEVKQGQQIMRVGSTGNSTGPHLHFEVRNGSGGYNNRIDPSPYLP